MIHLIGPYVVASVLIGVGSYGILARRNAVLVLIGLELLLAGGGLLLVTAGAVTGPTPGDRWHVGNVLPLFVITISAAEVVLALAVIVAVYRQRGTIDLTEPSREVQS